MTKVLDAREVQQMVNSYYEERDPLHIGAHPYNFRINKQGFTWIVKFTLDNIMDSEEHEIHINARTGNTVNIK